MLVNMMEILNHHVQILGFYIFSLSVGIYICKEEQSISITITTATNFEIFANMGLFVSQF